MSTLRQAARRREGTSGFSRVAWHWGAAAIALAGCDATAPDPDPPTVALTVTPASVQLGEPATLRWAVANASTCTASTPTGGVPGWQGGVTASADAVLEVTPDRTGTHQLSLQCQGDGGSTSASAVLEVRQPPAARYTASRVDGFVGDAVQLEWLVPWAASCTATGDWGGSHPPQGTAAPVIPRAGTSRFTLRCVQGGRDTVMEHTVTGVERALALDLGFAPRPRTISSSEGAPYGDANFWAGELLDTWNDYGPTRVIRTYICLNGRISAWECGDLPRPTGPLAPDFLAELEQRLAAYAGRGVRLLVRFIYNFGPIGTPDAPLDVTLAHVDQLMPVLLRHRDLVFALEAGFIGTWGEWHNSTHGNDSELGRRLVLDREVHHVAGAFPILVRYPAALLAYNGTASPNPDIGLHNDYFASDDHDGGTWIPGPGQTAEDLRQYALAVAAASMMVAEFGALDPVRQQCDALEAEMRRFRLQSLSLLIWPPEVAAALQAQGCLQRLLDRVGPRLELDRVVLAGEAQAGAVVNLSLTLRNDGFGRVLRDRPARLQVLSGGAVVAEEVLEPGVLDLRRLEPEAPGSGTTFNASVPLPATLPTGEVTLALVLDDPAPSLRGNAAYALPLNSRDGVGGEVFDPLTGRNLLARFTILRR